MDRVHRLRFHIYCELESYMPIENFPDGRERDRYDPHSIHFYSVDTDSDTPERLPLGTVRLVRDSGLGFPIEEEFDISAYRKRLEEKGGRTPVEVSRRMVLPEEESGFALDRINLMLLQAACQYSQKVGFTDFICTSHHQHQSFYEKLGFVDIGDPKFYAAVNTTAVPKALVMDQLDNPDVKGNLNAPWNKILYRKNPALVFLKELP